VEYLTDPSIVSLDPEVLLAQDKTRGVLQRVGTGEFHALIDCGALVVGMTNREVADNLMHQLPTSGFDAVVYIDAAGEKKAILRGDDVDAPPVNLQNLGVAMSRRFTFYDQVHTVGMDIKQTIDATAAVTLGKGMTLRDLSQGCWRMRGIGKGQRIKYIVTKEIAQMISRSLGSVVDLSITTSPPASDIIVWLTRTQMETESLQKVTLASACVDNIWRRKALSNLLNSTSVDSKATERTIKTDEAQLKKKISRLSPMDPLFQNRLLSLQEIGSKVKQFDLASMRQLESDGGVQAKNRLKDGNATTSTADAATDYDDGEKEENQKEKALKIVHSWLEHEGLLLKNEQTEAWLRLEMANILDQAPVCPRCRRKMQEDHCETPSCKEIEDKMRKRQEDINTENAKIYAKFHLWDINEPVANMRTRLKDIEKRYPSAYMACWFHGPMSIASDVANMMKWRIKWQREKLRTRKPPATICATFTMGLWHPSTKVLSAILYWESMS
jgi:hypothetical protein